ncbi:MAG: FtsQ-type POTRA domain-containing protein [Desulfomonile tiedjei]|nr:FtsQ-type POTRA domain-containing protein [Desulfomonile tiedjei]
MTSVTSPLLADKRLAQTNTADPVETAKRNRVVLRRLLITCGVIDAILVLLMVYLFFLHMPYFNLQQVEVTGNRRLSRAEVVEASETVAGINLLTVDLAAIAARLQRHPWIHSAAVYRKFPGSLIIEIEERTPRAILSAEKLYYVDDRAQFFTRLLPGDSVDYPLFTGISPEDLKSRGPEIQELIRRGLGMLDVMERDGRGMEPSAVAEIRLSLDEGLTLRTRDDRRVVLGNDNFESKLQRYARLKGFLIRRGEWQNARIINLDFKDRAVVRWDKPRVQG